MKEQFSIWLFFSIQDYVKFHFVSLLMRNQFSSYILEICQIQGKNRQNFLIFSRKFGILSQNLTNLDQKVTKLCETGGNMCQTTYQHHPTSQKHSNWFLEPNISKFQLASTKRCFCNFVQQVEKCAEKAQFWPDF